MCLNNFIHYTDTQIGRQYMQGISDMRYYSSLPLCALDAVFSIRASYEKIVNPLIDRVCKELDLARAADNPLEIPGEEQLSVSDFMQRLTEHYQLSKDAAPAQNGEILAEKINNRQRTSTRNGILKAEAFLRYLDVFRNNHIESYQDLNNPENQPAVEQALRKIPGQNVAVDYFFMLAGERNLVKVDTHLRRYVDAAVGKNLTNEAIINLFREAAAHYQKNGCSDMTPRHLDHIVWSWQKGR